jgi:hypothetical protein
MYPSTLLSTIALTVLLPLTALADPAKDQPQEQIIPLEKIWAYKMPGTRDIEEHADLADMKLLFSIFESWNTRADHLKFKNLARQGFAVPCSAQSALEAAHAIFVEGEKQRKRFTAEEELTVVFFAGPAGGNYVRLEQVQRKGNLIEIKYRLEPYFEHALSETFALIPLGKLPIGEYKVEMLQLPRREKFIAWGLEPFDKAWSSEVLCKPFSLTIIPKEKEPK